MSFYKYSDKDLAKFIKRNECGFSGPVELEDWYYSSDAFDVISDLIDSRAKLSRLEALQKAALAVVEDATELPTCRRNSEVDGDLINLLGDALEALKHD